ncbi:AAA family ATPase [Tomitella fengzijianii]|uniref:AAA family ATPase n=1 Tax=Tomitella fengzijianii TaxID=2597660 RepID=UPI00131B0406|nr:AAA family ATPase [Tomitella fengzijianii]
MPAPTFILTEEFEQALSQLRSGGNLFLTGKAGTGKSTLIRRFLAETDRRVLVAAPTGIAALNVGGYTIHRVFGFRAGTTLADVEGGAYRPGRFAKALSELQTLIIDEASMVRADLFDMLAAALGRFGPDPSAPFGGVQIVLVGDLFQLPPVVTEAEAAYFETRYATPYFFSADAYRGAALTTVDLTRVFRQSGDPRMATIFNAIREGTLVQRSRAELNARTSPDFTPPDDEFWLTLTTTNRMATSRNRTRLERLAGEEFAHHAERIGELDRFEAPTDDVLHFKVGAQVMMLTNDQSDRWVNGTIGRIVDAEWTERGCLVAVQFPGGDVAEVAAYRWEVTRPVVDGGGLRHEVIGSFTQLPFKLAWAITIHKSQGQTLDRLVVDLTGGTFATGQLYVALSRCTSMDGLVLTRPMFPKDLKTDRRILRFLRSATEPDAAARYCAIAALTVGDDSARSKPRPVELAVAFEDGTSVSSVINPQRDLADARRAYGITVSDVLLAPTLLEAWSMLLPLLDGCTPAGVGVDKALGHVDFELKRLGASMPMPLGVDVPAGRLSAGERSALRSGTAVERAQAVLQARERLDAQDPGAGAFDADAAATEADEAEVSAAADAAGTVGYLLTRAPDAPTPESALLPQFSAMLDVSRGVGAVLLGRGDAGTDRNGDAAGGIDPEILREARVLVAEQVRAAAARVPLTAEALDRLRTLETVLGADLTDGLAALEAGSAAGVLAPGTRVCFTGDAFGADGRFVSRDEMFTLAEARGLTPVNNVSKTKCDALVTAEIGSQSGKARKAREWGKPVVSADEFLAWARG